MFDALRMVRWTGLIFLAGLMMGCGAASEQAGQEGQATTARRIILLTNGNSPYWDACRIGLQQGAADFGLEAAGLTAVMEVNDGTPQGQIDKLRQFAIQSDIVGVAVSAIDADNVAIADAMRELKKKGVFVVSLDSDVNREMSRDAREFYIGTDNLVGGRILGIACKALLESRELESGSYVQFVGRTGAQNARDRMGGFNEGVGEAFTEADRMGDEMDLTRARENVRNAIRNHNDLQALIGIWSYNAPAIVDIVEEENAGDRFTVATFDAEPAAIAKMGDGLIDVMVVQNPYDMGYQAVQCLKALIGGDQATIDEMFPNRGEEDGDLYDTGLKVVVPSEGSPLTAELFGDKTQFVNFDDFKKWLDQYNLTGS